MINSPFQVPENLPFDNLVLETEQLMKTYPPDVMEIVVKEMHEEKYLNLLFFRNNLFINFYFI